MLSPNLFFSLTFRFFVEILKVSVITLFFFFSLFFHPITQVFLLPNHRLLFRSLILSTWDLFVFPSDFAWSPFFRNSVVMKIKFLMSLFDFTQNGVRSFFRRKSNRDNDIVNLYLNLFPFIFEVLFYSDKFNFKRDLNGILMIYFILLCQLFDLTFLFDINFFFLLTFFHDLTFFIDFTFFFHFWFGFHS